MKRKQRGACLPGTLTECSVCLSLCPGSQGTVLGDTVPVSGAQGEQERWAELSSTFTARQRQRPQRAVSGGPELVPKELL